MFDKNEEVTAAVESLLKLANSYERGDCISWGEIEAITGPRYENRARHVIRKWRMRMEKEREIVTFASITVGIRLLTDQEAADEIPRHRQRKAYRQIRRALRQTECVNVARLTDHQRRMLVSQRLNMAEQRRGLFRSRRQLEKGIVATETNPRRRAVPA